MSNETEPTVFPGVTERGLTKREYFALHLMCALKSQVDPATGDDAYTHHGAAAGAVACADELIARLAGHE